MNLKVVGGAVFGLVVMSSLVIYLSEEGSKERGGTTKTLQMRAEESEEAYDQDDSSMLRALRGVTRTMSRLANRISSLEGREGAGEGGKDNDKEVTDDDHEIAAFDNAVEQRAAAIAKTVTYDEMLVAEKRDDDWAEESEAHIETLFAEGDFAGTELESVECKSTFCRVAANHDDEDSYTRFEMMKRELPGSYHIQRLEPDSAGRSRTVAYFIREGETQNNPIFADMMSKDAL